MNEFEVGTKQFYDQLASYPEEIVAIMDLVLEQLFTEHMHENNANGGLEVDPSACRIQTRPYNLACVHTLRNLNPSNIDQLVAVQGMVTRVSPVIPDLAIGFFKCILCNQTDEVMIDRGQIDEPQSCPNCRNKFCMDYIHNRCKFKDKQMIRLQETPGDIPEGETPQAITLFAFDDLVDSVRPGDNVEVTGIFRAIPKRVNPRMRSVRSVYKTHFDVRFFVLPLPSCSFHAP